MPSSLLTTLILHDDLVEKDWDESQHPREPAGSAGGGRFAGGGGGGAPAAPPGAATMRANVARAAAFQAAGRDPEKLIGAARLLALNGIGTPEALAAEAGLRARAAGLSAGKVADIEHRALVGAARGAALGAKLPPQPAPIVAGRGDIQGAGPAERRQQYFAALRAAGRDPRQLREAAALGARLGVGGVKTLARDVRQAAEEAGRGLPPQHPELKVRTPIRAQDLARSAAQHALGIQPKARAPRAPKQPVMGAQPANKPPVAPVKPSGAPVKPETAGGAARQMSFTGTGFARQQAALPLHPAGAAAAPAPSPVEAAERHLMTATVTGNKGLGGGVNESQLLTFDDGSKGVFKPQAGAASYRLRQNITPGKDMEREVATWQVAKLVGLHDMVPATVIRTVKGRVGSVQNFVPDSKVAAEVKNPYDGSKDFARATVFDAVIGNEDRHAYNWMINEKTDKITLIDHGLTFPESTKLEAVRGFMNRAGRIQEGYESQPNLVGTPADYIKPYVDNKSQILNTLTGLKLPPSAIRGVSLRIDAIANMNIKSRWKDIGAGRYGGLI